ncbi:F-type H+-transporting ATPase subunit delta [Candidatus Magnetaquicoccaceae bacterium FCR-1]|uniref:ATP synthase subunit delta n=1 Tax=Candidatus Magnetaquiglobus chichijimensis TaxID=3141448 RepID=A0ABQ0CDA5_9PROT
MLNPALAKRYATALADLASEEKKLDAVAEDLTRFVDVVNTTPGLRLLLTSPTAPAQAKHAAIDAFIAHAAPTKLLGNFLKLLIDKRRMEYVEAIINAYQRETEARSGRIAVELQTPVSLDKRVEEDLKSALSRITGKEVRLDSRVEPALLGGIVVRIGSLMMDYSVSNHLNRLKAQMRG